MVPMSGFRYPKVWNISEPLLANSLAVASDRVTKPRRNANSTATGRLTPNSSAAISVTRLRLVPGHSASAWASPMMTAWGMVMAEIESTLTLILGWYFTNTRMATPPTNQAATTGHGCSRCFLMVSPARRPITAAGMKATTSEMSVERPSALRPMTPSAMRTNRFR